MSEWFKERAWKARVRQKRTGGSNPPSSVLKGFKMQKEILFLSNGGIGVSFCIFGGLIERISLSLSDCVSFPEVKFYNKFFERFFSYLEGNIVDFREFLGLFNLKFSNFQKIVYEELLKITFGNIVSYEELALRFGNKNLKRAVGRILGLNPFPVIIPCHRVVPKSFSCYNIGGYSEGVEIKRKLLKIEGIL